MMKAPERFMTTRSPFLFLTVVRFWNLSGARILGFEGGLLGGEARGAADVEGAHGELGAGLADGLGGDDAHRQADLHDLAGGEIASVAQGADPARGLAGEHGADADALDARGLHVVGRLLGDLGRWPTMTLPSMDRGCRPG